MIRFLGQEDGQEVLEIMDYSRESEGYQRVTFRPIHEDEPWEHYVECLMNKYWHTTGKNIRRYYE